MVNSTSLLRNASFHVVVVNNPSAVVYLYNSTWGGQKSEPVLSSKTRINEYALTLPNNWNSVSLNDTLLDITKTENNTWFIGLLENSTYSTECYWHHMNDFLGGGDEDDTDSVYAATATTWENITGIFPNPPVDLTLKIDLSPKDNNPLPSEIGLKINGTEVNDDTKGSGYCSTENQEFTDSNGELEFEIADEWWDVSCNITKVQINYTKADLKANSTYIILQPNLILWNASINENIICFDSRISDYNYISFMIPAEWTNIRAFNGSVENPVDSSASAVNGYREVIVHDAGNGSKWFLTARVDNRAPPPPDGDNGDDDDKDGEEQAIPGYNTYILLSLICLISIISIRKHQYK